MAENQEQEQQHVTNGQHVITRTRACEGQGHITVIHTRESDAANTFLIYGTIVLSTVLHCQATRGAEVPVARTLSPLPQGEKAKAAELLVLCADSESMFCRPRVRL
jgi:hypothetical protein